MAKSSSILTFLPFVLLLAGCGGSSGAKDEAPYRYVGPAPAADTRHIVLGRVPNLGVVLIDGAGHPFYAFMPKGGGSACTGSCTSTWPLFKLTRFLTLDTTPLLKESRFKIEFDPEGSRMVRFEGMALHTYSGDTSPGVANGQGLSTDGGHWYVISQSGKLVRKTS